MKPLKQAEPQNLQSQIDYEAENQKLKAQLENLHKSFAIEIKTLDLLCRTGIVSREQYDAARLLARANK